MSFLFYNKIERKKIDVDGKVCSIFKDEYRVDGFKNRK